MRRIEPVLSRHGVGYATEGAGFYAWDVEVRPLTVWAVALHQAARPVCPVAAPEPAGRAQKRNE